MRVAAVVCVPATETISLCSGDLFDDPYSGSVGKGDVAGLGRHELEAEERLSEIEKRRHVGFARERHQTSSSGRTQRYRPEAAAEKVVWCGSIQDVFSF